MKDAEIVEGLKKNHRERLFAEKGFYKQYEYFIGEGCRKYHLSQEDSFSAYSDAVLSAIYNIVNSRFDGRVSLKTYLFQIFHHKIVDLIRKNTNNKQTVHRSGATPELMNYLPENAKTAIEKLIDQEKITLLVKQLEIIGEKCKKILLLFEDGYSDQEIAEKLNYNGAAAAKTTRLRCREKMKTLLSRYG